MTSKILFLGTEFESSRIKDTRLDKIFDEMNYKEEKKEELYSISRKFFLFIIHYYIVFIRKSFIKSRRVERG